MGDADLPTGREWDLMLRQMSEMQRGIRELTRAVGKMATLEEARQYQHQAIVKLQEDLKVMGEKIDKNASSIHSRVDLIKESLEDELDSLSKLAAQTGRDLMHRSGVLRLFREGAFILFVAIVGGFATGYFTHLYEHSKSVSHPYQAPAAMVLK